MQTTPPTAAPVASARASAGSFRTAYLRLCNKRGNDWWSIVFGYPLGRALLVPMSGWMRVTPTALTLVGFACKCAAAALLVTPGTAPLAGAIALLQASVVLDAMDGTLARDRGAFTRVGALLDKVTDAVGLFAITSALGWRGYTSTGDPRWIAVGAAGGAAYLALCYMYWIVQALATDDHRRPSHTAGLAAPLSSAGAWREWRAGWRRILRFQEADLYLWMSLLAVAGRWREAAALVAATQCIGVVIQVVAHTRALGRADRGGVS